jgi:hypothetical protein
MRTGLENAGLRRGVLEGSIAAVAIEAPAVAGIRAGAVLPDRVDEEEIEVAVVVEVAEGRASPHRCHDLGLHDVGAEAKGDAGSGRDVAEKAVITSGTPRSKEGGGEEDAERERPCDQVRSDSASPRIVG